MSLLSSLAIVAVLLGGGGRQAVAEPSAVDVADRLQKKYDSIRDFSADFLQRYEGGALKRTREERGALLVKKPGKMRWAYKQPEEKLFVSNGVRFYQYIPADRQVIVADPPDDSQPAMAFLAGRGHLTRDFKVSFAQSQAPDRWTLRLDPKTPQQDFDWLEISASRDSLELRTLVIAERQGSRSTFTFSNFKANPGLSDKDFDFAVPKGVEVITNARKR
jgi:outer membrane lipoprotein carrier protein